MILYACALNLVDLLVQAFVSLAFIQEKRLFFFRHFLIFIKDRISVGKQVRNVLLCVELQQSFYLYLLLLAKFLHLLLDILQLLQGLLCVFIYGFLLFVLAHAVAAVPQDQPDDLSIGLAHLALH